MASSLCVAQLLILAAFVAPLPTRAMECFTGNPESVQSREVTTACDDGRDFVANTVVFGLNMAKLGLGIILPLINPQAAVSLSWIDQIGTNILARTGIDLTGQKEQTEWVKKVLGLVDFNMAKVCWVSFDRESSTTRNRGCGAGGDLEWFGGQLLNWLDPNKAGSEKSLHLMAGSAICFVAPLDHSQEICMCKENGCNKDKGTARRSLNIPESAESVQCGGENCPLMDLSKIIDSKWDSFNAACYQKPGESQEHCFSTEGIYDENAVLSARLSAGLGEGPFECKDQLCPQVVTYNFTRKSAGHNSGPFERRSFGHNSSSGTKRGGGGSTHQYFQFLALLGVGAHSFFVLLL